MPVAYHVDRSNSLSSGQSLALNTDFVQSGLNPDDMIYVQELFPSGISKHGEQYLSDSAYFFQHPAIYGQDVFEASNFLSAHITEFTFELIRQIFFPNQLSRFQSIFALPSLEDLSKWPELAIPECRIFEIEYDDLICETYDATTLSGGLARSNPGEPLMQGFSPRICFQNAQVYWSRDFIENLKPEILIPYPVTIGKRIF